MFNVKVKDQRIIFSSAEAESRFNRLLLSYNNTGKTLSLNIEPYSRVVTDDQMGLFRAMVAAGKEHTGMSFSEFENELITNHAPFKYETDILGKKTKERIHPQEMTNRQFQSFVEECVRFMNEFFNMNFTLA